MTITDDYKIFADKYHNKQHLPDDIIKNIMDINTDIIKKEKQYKKEHKQKFNIVVREIYSIFVDLMMRGVDDDIFENMMDHSNCLTIVKGYKNIYRFDPGMGEVYTKDMLLIYDSLENCINDINGENEWELQLNTAS